MFAKLFVIILGVFIFSLMYSLEVYASDIKINEVVVHPSTGNKEWVELYNPSKIDVSNYYIDDDTNFTSDTGNSPKKSLKEIQGVDTQYPYMELTSSMFNNSGDSVVLFDSTGAIVDQYTYVKDPGADISLGRFPDGSGDFAVLSSKTKGSVNSQIQASPTSSPTTVPSPTHTPTPPHTQTPIKLEPTPTKLSPPTTKLSLPSNAPAEKIGEVQNSEPQNNNSSSISFDSSSSAVATNSSQAAVLGESISNTPIPEKKQKTLVKAVQSFNFLPIIFSGLGGICLIACGILVFLKIRIKNLPAGRQGQEV